MKKNSFLMIIYEILGLIVPLILTPYLSRKLGASGIGLYSYTYSIALYFVIFIQLGVKLYGKREIAKVNDDKEKYYRNLRNPWLFLLLMFALFAVTKQSIIFGIFALVSIIPGSIYQIQIMKIRKEAKTQEW